MKTGRRESGGLRKRENNRKNKIKQREETGGKKSQKGRTEGEQEEERVSQLGREE